MVELIRSGMAVVRSSEPSGSSPRSLLLVLEPLAGGGGNSNRDCGSGVGSGTNVLFSLGGGVTGVVGVAVPAGGYDNEGCGVGCRLPTLEPTVPAGADELIGVAGPT